MKNMKHHSTRLAVLALGVLGATSLIKDVRAQAEEPQVATTLLEIEQINSEITRLKALTTQAEERVKLLRAQNQIEQEIRQGRQAAGEIEHTKASLEAAPLVALISGQGPNLRAVFRYANGTSDEAWVGKQLAGGYVVQSITSRQVRLRTPEGKVIVAGTASPIPPTPEGPKSVSGHTASTTPGAFPRGAMSPGVPGMPSAPVRNPG